MIILKIKLKVHNKDDNDNANIKGVVKVVSVIILMSALPFVRNYKDY